MLSSVFFEAGDTIYVEDPSYFVALQMFKMAKFNIVGGKNRFYCLLYGIDRNSCAVPTDSDGIIPSALEETVTSQNSKPATRPLTEARPYRGMIYLIPTFHNPTGKCLSPGKSIKRV